VQKLLQICIELAFGASDWAKRKEFWREGMMLGWKRGLWLMVLSCWVPVAVADLFVGGVTGRAESGVAGSAEKKPTSSADFFFRQDAAPEEDYQAGIIAYNRNELIEAQGIFERAANKGHTGAMVRLAEILDRSGFVAEAARMYLKAAEFGNADAQFGLGGMYMDLNAYDLNQLGAKADPLAARKWFTLAAEQGHADALKLITGVYIGGGMGITDAERSDTEVLKWINLAIDKIKDADAMDALAAAYRTGKYGLAVDPKLADEWVAKAKKTRGIKEEEVKKKKKKRI